MYIYIYEKLPVTHYEKIKESESRHFLLLSMRTHTILWSLTIMISKYFISSNILRGICKIKNISNYRGVECFLSTVYFGDFDHEHYCKVIKLISQFKGGWTKVCCVTSDRSELRDLQLAFSCASARTSHPVPRRAALLQLRTHTQGTSDTSTLILSIYNCVCLCHEFKATGMCFSSFFIFPGISKIVSLNFPWSTALK